MSYIGMGVSPPGGNGQLTQMDCMQQGKFYVDGMCLSLHEYTAKLCAEQIGGVYNPATGECEMKAQTGLSEVAAKAACEAVGGVWNAQAKSCAWPTSPTMPGGPPGPPQQQPPPPPPEKAGVDWTTIAAVGLGLSVLYVLARK